MSIVVPARAGEPTDPVRVRAFAEFFKRYMSVSSVVAAALPIPVTAFGVIPTYAAHTALLSAYTPLFCFLALAFIFYSRHQLAQVMFSQERSAGRWSDAWTRVRRAFVQLLPVLLISGSVGCLYRYHTLLGATVRGFDRSTPDGSSLDVLRDVPLAFVPDGTLLMLLYMGIFVCAEAAFIVMAIREYLQDLAGLTERDLIFGREAGRVAARRHAPEPAPLVVEVAG